MRVNADNLAERIALLAVPDQLLVDLADDDGYDAYDR